MNAITEKVNKQFEFGFVSEQIRSNFFAWSTLCGTGTEEDAVTFYRHHINDAQEERLVWFCIGI